MKTVNFSDVPRGSIITFGRCTKYYMKTESVEDGTHIRGIVDLATGQYVSEDFINDQIWRNTYLVAENLESFLK